MGYMRNISWHGNDALIVGRFQPMHKGHLEVIKEISAKSDKIIVGIGSAQHSHIPDNPFTAGERYLMISDTLKAEGVDNAYIVPIEDINRYSIWVSHVECMCPPFSIVYSNNKYTRLLFMEAGYEVRKSPIFNRKEYSGIEVRRRIFEDDNWEDLIPKQVVDVIRGIGGVNRIKALMNGSPDKL